MHLFLGVAVVVILAMGAFLFFQKTPSQQPGEQMIHNDFEIKELNLKFSVTSDIKDVTYAIKDFPQGKAVLFSTQSLQAVGGTDCSADKGAIGAIGLITGTYKDTLPADYLVQLDDLYIAYSSPQANCSEAKAAQDLQTKQIISLKESLKTIKKTTTYAAWKTIANQEYGFMAQYPDNFFDIGHEPTVVVGDCNYQVFPNQCPDINGLVLDNVGNLQNIGGNKISVNSNDFCKYEQVSAAAGHQYFYDYYLTVRNQKCLVVQLATFAASCDNYLPLEQGNTEQEKNYTLCISKNIERPKVLDQIVATFKFNQ